MPNLIKGANVIWNENESVTLKTDIQKNQITHLKNKSTDNKNTSGKQEKYDEATEILKARLEEEYRKKNEGLDARYRLLCDKAQIDSSNIVFKARVDAEAMIKTANEEAENIINSATNNYQVKLNEAKQDGYNQGLEMAKEEYQKNMKMLKNVIDGISETEKYILEKSRDDVAGLAVEIFRKIVSMNLDQNDEFLQNMITEQLRSFKDYKRVKIYLAGYDIYVETLADTLIQNKLLQSSDLLTIEMIDDAPIGTCIIETENEMADISVSEQLENLIKNVRNVQIEEDSDEEYDEDYQ